MRFPIGKPIVNSSFSLVLIGNRGGIGGSGLLRYETSGNSPKYIGKYGFSHLPGGFNMFSCGFIWFLMVLIMFHMALY